MNKEASTYYNKVLYTDENFENICSTELKGCSQKDFQELFANYSTELDNEFIAYDSIQSEKGLVRRHKMTKDRFKRVQIAMLILQTCADGIPYSQKVIDSANQYWNNLLQE